MLFIQEKQFKELSIEAPIFDSIKEDYPAFDKWFEKKKEASIYSVYDQENLVAVLYLKTEHEVDEAITPKMKPKKRLKVGTFKVEKEGVGIGRMLLQFTYQYASEQDVDEIYLTVYEKKENHHKFIVFIEKNGFNFHGYKNEERVYVKQTKNE